jgi:hypothetical protein
LFEIHFTGNLWICLNHIFLAILLLATPIFLLNKVYHRFEI